MFIPPLSKRWMNYGRKRSVRKSHTTKCDERIPLLPQLIGPGAQKDVERIPSVPVGLDETRSTSRTYSTKKCQHAELRLSCYPTRLPESTVPVSSGV